MTTRTILLVLCAILISVIGFFGLFLCFKDPTGTQSGMSNFLPVLQKRFSFASFLFQDLRFHGVVMLLVAGLPQLIATVLLFCGHPFAHSFTTFCGVLLVLWCIWEMTIIGFSATSLACLLIGCVEIVLTRNLSLWFFN